MNINEENLLLGDQSLPSAYVQGGLKKITPTVIREPTPPRFFQPRLPPIKDHVIKDNLTQKPTLRCKTPRPQSFYDPSMAVISLELEQSNKTRHPLQVLIKFFNEE